MFPSNVKYHCEVNIHYQVKTLLQNENSTQSEKKPKKEDKICSPEDIYQKGEHVAILVYMHRHWHWWAWYFFLSGYFSLLMILTNASATK